MKKYNVLLGVLAAFIAMATAGFGLFAYLQAGRITPEKQEPNREISLKFGETKVDIPYETLGISVDMAKREDKTGIGGNFGLTSLFAVDDKEGERLQPDISVNTQLLAHAIVSIFPSLNMPEEAHASFFIMSTDQKIKPTFNVRKLIAQLKEAVNVRESAVEIEEIPENLEARKKALAGKEAFVKLEGDDVPTLEWKITMDIALDTDKLRDFLKDQVAPKVERDVQHASIKQFIDEGKAANAVAEGIAKNGISVPIEKNIMAIRDAVLSNVFEIDVTVEFEDAYIFNETETDLGYMQLLSVGRSNFAGSPEGRAFNIQKGMSEKMNNILIPPGAEFSFNSFLGPITAAKGWKKALGIFGGKNLIPTLGGGLCQVSTTVYRAALNAGLPIVERKQHSLYVTYYKKFGEGLDATIFSTGPDLVFLNDTPSYIFIQSYVDGDDAYVKFFGTSDGRETRLKGPYRSRDIPQEKGYKPSLNEIVWFRTVEWPDGRKQEEMITSRYRALPRHP